MTVKLVDCDSGSGLMNDRTNWYGTRGRNDGTDLSLYKVKEDLIPKPKSEKTGGQVQS